MKDKKVIWLTSKFDMNHINNIIKSTLITSSVLLLSGAIQLYAKEPLIQTGLVSNGEYRSLKDHSNEELISSLEKLRERLLQKIDTDLDQISRGFADAKALQRAQFLSDILGAPLSIITGTISVISSGLSIKRAFQVDSSIFSKPTVPIAALSFLMTLDSLRGSGEDLQLALDGPAYGSDVKKMLEDAYKESSTRLFFNYDAYKSAIALHLESDGDSMLMIVPHKSANVDRKNIEIVRGAFKVKTAIIKNYGNILKVIRENSLPADVETHLVTIIKQITSGVTNSVIHSTNIQYDTLIYEGGEYVRGKENISLGSIGELAKRRLSALNNYDKDIERKQTMVVSSAISSSISSISIFITGPVGEGLGTVNKVFIIPKVIDFSDKVYNLSVYATNPREEVNMIPLEMLLILPKELSDIWMVADDLARYIEYYIDVYKRKNIGNEAELASALIIDRSGSMKKSSQDGISTIKIDKAKQAVRALIKAMPVFDEVSISTFSNEGETPLPMKKVGSVKAELDKVLLTITPSGKTNIGGGLSKGFVELDKGSGKHKMAILLSDGENNVGDWRDIVQEFEKKEWPICTLGFGKDADGGRSGEALREIAADTGCVYKYAETLELINNFQELSAYAQNNSIVLSVRDLLLSRDILDYEFNVVENADSFAVYTSWPGSKLSTKLISPDRHIITDAEARNNGGRYEEGKTFQMLEVKSPAPGTWNIEVSWAEAPPIPEQVNISIAEKSDVFAWLNGFRPMYSINEPVTINVNAANVVNNKKVPLIGGAVTAEIIKPGADVVRMVHAQSTQWTMFKDVLQNNTREVTLYDDGNHNDYKAGDGVFGGIFRETDKSGAYLVNATIRGQKQNGDPVEKLITGSFQVGPITNNPVTSSQSLRYTREARRHFQRPNPTPQQFESTNPLDGIEQLENSADPLESIDSLMRSGG